MEQIKPGCNAGCRVQQLVGWHGLQGFQGLTDALHLGASALHLNLPAADHIMLCAAHSSAHTGCWHARQIRAETASIIFQKAQRACVSCRGEH